MRIYIESNLVLEIALQQEQHEICEALVLLGEQRRIDLVVPAFCVVEPYQTLIRRGIERRRIQSEVESELRQLERTHQYRDLLEGFRSTTALLSESIDDELRRLDALHARLLAAAHLIPLSTTILQSAVVRRARHDLSPPDSIVLASVLEHLQAHPDPSSCFATRDRRAFDQAHVVTALAEHGCRLFREFEGAHRFVAARLERSS